MSQQRIVVLRGIFSRARKGKEEVEQNTNVALFPLANVRYTNGQNHSYTVTEVGRVQQIVKEDGSGPVVSVKGRHCCYDRYPLGDNVVGYPVLEFQAKLSVVSGDIRNPPIVFTKDKISGELYTVYVCKLAFCSDECAYAYLLDIGHNHEKREEVASSIRMLKNRHKLMFPDHELLPASDWRVLRGVGEGDVDIDKFRESNSRYMFRTDIINVTAKSEYIVL